MMIMFIFRFRVMIVHNSFCPGDALHFDGLVPSDELRKIKILDIGCGGGICTEVRKKP